MPINRPSIDLLGGGQGLNLKASGARENEVWDNSSLTQDGSILSKSRNTIGNPSRKTATVSDKNEHVILEGDERSEPEEYLSMIHSKSAPVKSLLSQREQMAEFESRFKRATTVTAQDKKQLMLAGLQSTGPPSSLRHGSKGSWFDPRLTSLAGTMESLKKDADRTQELLFMLWKSVSSMSDQNEKLMSNCSPSQTLMRIKLAADNPRVSFHDGNSGRAAGGQFARNKVISGQSQMSSANQSVTDNTRMKVALRNTRMSVSRGAGFGRRGTNAVGLQGGIVGGRQSQGQHQSNPDRFSLSSLAGLHAVSEDDDNSGVTGSAPNGTNSWAWRGKMAGHAWQKDKDMDRESLHFVDRESQYGNAAGEDDRRWTAAYDAIPEDDELPDKVNDRMSVMKIIGPGESADPADEISLPPHIETLLKLRFHSYCDTNSMEITEAHFLQLVNEHGLGSQKLEPSQEEDLRQVFQEVATASKALQIGGFQGNNSIPCLGYMGFEQALSEVAELMEMPRELLIDKFLPKSDKDASLLKGSGTSEKLVKIFERTAVEGNDEIELSDFITMCRESQLFNASFTIADVYIIHTDLGSDDTKLDFSHFLTALESIISRGKVTAEEVLEKLVWNNRALKLDGAGPASPSKHENKQPAASNWGMVEEAVGIFKTESSHSIQTMRNQLRRRSSFGPTIPASRSPSMFGPDMVHAGSGTGSQGLGHLAVSRSKSGF
jgi:hypothetical protein